MELPAVAGIAVTVIQDLMESSSSSSDESTMSEDEQQPENSLPVAALCLYREEHEKQSAYLQVIDRYSDLDHWRHFRVTRSTATCLIDFVKPFIDCVFHGGCHPLSTEETVYITLVYLGNQGAIRLISDKFGRSEFACWKCIRFMTKLLSEQQDNFIKWPSVQELPSVTAEFQARAGFPGVVSAVDGCHIKIHPPAASQKSYLNYKRFHSVILLAFVRADRQFTYVSVGFPGSNHDSYVLQRSRWWDQAHRDISSLFPSSDFHAIGDSAFPLRDFLLVPYKQSGQQMLQTMKVFNRKISSTRVVVEQAFGDLQNRFRRCTDIHGSIEHAVDTVVAACVMHNICIINGDMNFPTDSDVDPDMCVHLGQTTTDVTDAGGSGIVKRNRLARLLK